MDLEDRVQNLENIVRRLAKIGNLKVVTPIQPMPIFTYASGDPIDGVVMKAMLFKGTINSIAIMLPKVPEDIVCIELNLLTDNVGSSKSFFVSSPMELVKLDIPVENGTAASIKVVRTGQSDEIYEICISLMYTPHVSYSKAIEFLASNVVERADEDA